MSKAIKGVIPKTGVPAVDSHYSGPNSTKFWKRVNSFPYSQGGQALYIAGCLLQDAESRVLQILHSFEEAELRRKSKV